VPFLILLGLPATVNRCALQPCRLRCSLRHQVRLLLLLLLLPRLSIPQGHRIVVTLGAAINVCTSCLVNGVGG
jgi:hypothetical protein